jgi:hypothetical protein
MIISRFIYMPNLREARLFVFRCLNQLSESPVQNQEKLIGVINVLRQNRSIMTQNLRGYWIDVNQLSEDCVGRLMTFLEQSASSVP